MRYIHRRLIVIFGIVCLISILFLSIISFNVYCIDNNFRKLDNFIGKYGEDINILWNKSTGFPRRIYNIKSQPVEGDPKKIALSFLSENSSFLGIETNNLRFQYIKENRGGKSVRFNQTYKGIPVRRGTVSVHIKEDGTIDSMWSKYKLFSDLNIIPSITEKEAEMAVAEDLDIAKVIDVKERIADDALGPEYFIFPDDNLIIPIEKELKPVEPQLTIYAPGGGSVYLCWKFKFFLELPYGPYGAWNYYVDAYTGKIVKKYDSRANFSVNGNISGYIWPEDGADTRQWGDLQTAKSTIYYAPSWYVCNYTYANNNGDYSMTYYCGNTCYIYQSQTSGTRGIGASGYYGGIPVMNSASFCYPSLPGTVNFLFNFGTGVTYSAQDCTNLCYHLNKYLHEYYDDVHDYELGYNIWAYAHAQADPDNSWYDDDNKRLYFGNGGTYFRNGARALDIIIHELQHAVTDEIFNGFDFDPFDPNDHIRNAINEAWSDYFAGAVTDDPNQGEWYCIYPSDVRHIQVDKVYPDDMDPNNYYATSLIMSSTFWDIRDELSDDDADKLIFDALEELPETFGEVRSECITSAINLSLDPNDIEDIFDDHGIDPNVP